MITTEQLVAANKTIKTTGIQGKQYAEVAQRVKAFRSICPNGAITTELLSNENGVAIFKATIYGEDGNVLGTGTAYEKEGSTFINKTSYIENCETSAIGRALGMCGFGIEVAIASADEVQNAILNQGEKPKNNQPQEAPQQGAKPMGGKGGELEQRINSARDREELAAIFTAIPDSDPYKEYFRDLCNNRLEQLYK